MEPYRNRDDRHTITQSTAYPNRYDVRSVDDGELVGRVYFTTRGYGCWRGSEYVLRSSLGAALAYYRR